jgi:signal transduction histidine kinase/HAMP domain-containing protein
MIKKIANIPLRFKLIISFILIISINGIFGFMNINIMKQLGEMVNLTYDKALMSGTFAQSSKFDFSQYDSDVKNALLAMDMEDFKKNLSRSNRRYKTLLEDLSVVKERAMSKKSSSIVDEIIADLSTLEAFKKELSANKELTISNRKINLLMPLEHGWEENKLKSNIYKKLTALYDDAAEVGYNFRMSSEETNKKNLHRTIWILAFCGLTGLTLSIVISYLVISPLFKLQTVCKNVSEGNYTSRASIHSKDEFGTLAKAFNIMLNTIEEKDENISSLLSSLPFGLFYFDEKGNISKERSQSTDLIFTNFSKYSTLVDFFNDHDCKNKRIMDIVSATFKGLIPFDSAVFLFPDLINADVEGEERNIQLSFKPKYGANEKLEKVILIAEDITEKNRALATSRNLTERVERVSKVSNDIVGFKEFLPAVRHLFSSIINTLNNFSADREPDLKRDLHSLKGLLGIFAFSSSATSIHETESLLEIEPETRTNEAAKKISSSLETFEEQANDILKLLALNVDSGLKYFSVDKIARLKELARSEQYVDVTVALENLDKFPLEKVLAKYSAHAQEIAFKLEDKKVKLIFEPSDEVSYEEVQRLDTVLIHVLNNSIDHGIEKLEERLKNNKSETGEIKISCKRTKDLSLEFKISDDGKGINGEYLLEKAITSGLISQTKADQFSEEEKINLIFISGLSSKEETTETSGRGVGMDAVKHYIESIGGSIQLLTKKGIGTTFTLRIPALTNA